MATQGELLKLHHFLFPQRQNQDSARAEKANCSCWWCCSVVVSMSSRCCSARALLFVLFLLLQFQQYHSWQGARFVGHSWRANQVVVRGSGGGNSLLKESRELGSGSYGLVEAGILKTNGQHVVTKKVVGNSRSSKKKAADYLHREAAINARLLKEGRLEPHLAPYLGKAELSDGTPCLIWSFRQGATTTLCDYIEQPGGLSALANALGVDVRLVLWHVLNDLSFALEAMHDAGVIYRDLKPENILVDKSSQTLRLIDLGSAADLNAPAWGAGRYQPGVLPCSPLYMAPEAAIDWANPFAFDLYSLGVTMLRLSMPALLNSEATLTKFVGEMQAANHDLDKWLQDRLANTLVEAPLLEGLTAFRDDGSPANGGATLGTAGWKMLTRLLVANPKRRLSLGAIRSLPAMNRALALTEAEVRTEADEEDDDCEVPIDAGERPALIQLSLNKPLGMVLEERATGAAQLLAGGLMVASLVEGGAAERSGAVEVGDWLLRVGDEDVSQGHFDDVMGFLRFGSKAKVDLIFERHYSPQSMKPPTAVGSGAGRVAVRDQGQFSEQGGRSHMEDRISLMQVSEGTLMAAVFDGHAGSSAAEFGSKTIASALEGAFKHPVAGGSAGGPTVMQPLLRAWRHMCDKWSEMGDGSGTTATIALLQDTGIYVANCGDSRAVVLELDSTGPAAIVGATIDHRVDDPAELERISGVGGEISCDRGIMRIVKANLRLAVARAMTSKSWLSAGVSNEADEYIWDDLRFRHDVENPSHALIVASDGIWHKVSNEDAARLLTSWQRELGVSAAVAAEMLCNEAMRRGGNDNRAAVVVYLHAAAPAA